MLDKNKKRRSLFTSVGSCILAVPMYALLLYMASACVFAAGDMFMKGSIFTAVLPLLSAVVVRTLGVLMGFRLSSSYTVTDYLRSSFDTEVDRKVGETTKADLHRIALSGLLLQASGKFACEMAAASVLLWFTMN